MKQATLNCFPASLVKDVYEEVLSKCSLTVCSSPPQADAAQITLQRVPSAQGGQQPRGWNTIFEKKQLKLTPHCNYSQQNSGVIWWQLGQ